MGLPTIYIEKEKKKVRISYRPPKDPYTLHEHTHLHAHRYSFVLGCFPLIGLYLRSNFLGIPPLLHNFQRRRPKKIFFKHTLTSECFSHQEKHLHASKTHHTTFSPPLGKARKPHKVPIKMEEKSLLLRCVFRCCTKKEPFKKATTTYHIREKQEFFFRSTTTIH